MVYVLDTSKTLRNGDKGPEVTLLQTALNALGYEAGAPDGVFGGNTKSAVSRLQEAAGLGADGIAGKNTYAALISALESAESGGNSADVLAEVSNIASHAKADLMGWLDAGSAAAGDPALLEQWVAEGKERLEQAFGMLESTLANA